MYIAASIIMICLFGMGSYDTSEAIEFNNANVFSIIKDIEYKELPKPIPQNSQTKVEIKEEKQIPIEENEIPSTEEIIFEEFQFVEENNIETTLQESNIYNDITDINDDNNIDMNTSGLTQETGVNFYNGRTETYYSSNVLYHQDIDQWIVDDEGFYRTDEGYYVVAASDKEQGTTFEGSKGTCIVLDSGCEEGLDDYYVNW